MRLGHITDKQRVELLLPSQMMLAVVIAGFSEETKETAGFIKLTAKLIESGEIAIQSIADKDRNKILRRVKALNEKMVRLAIPDDLNDIPKLGLIYFHIISQIIESGIVVYDIDDCFGYSLQVFMDSIQGHASIEKRNLSAIKKARKILEWLRGQGYYLTS